jgi:hypothetical protein
MRKLVVACAGALLGVAALCAAGTRPQTSSQPQANASRANATLGAQGQTEAKVPDLSGDWGNPVGAGGGGFVIGDPGDRKAGTPQDSTPYQPWALAKLNSERPENGPHATFENTTDPRLKYCDPVGVPRIYLVPTQFRFVQTPDIVYILYQYGPTWRPIAMNRPHRPDPDPTWWGDSVGKYENDTLVIDTIGFNDKTWLDHVGRPHSEDLHLIERFRRINKDTLQMDLTFDDPKAYTKTWYGRKIFALQHGGFEDAYACSMSEYEHFRQSVVDPVTAPK